MVEGATDGVRVEPAGQLGQAWLEAETLVVDMQWKRGIEVSAVEDLGDIIVEEDSAKHRFSQTKVHFDEFQDDPVMIAVPDPGHEGIAFDFTTATGFTLTPAVSPTLVGAGPSPDYFSVGENTNPGFHHNHDGKTITAHGTGSVRVEGSFLLFVHEVVMHVDHADGEWSDWTGHWQDDTVGPVQEYEFRITTIQVHNGTFAASSRLSVDFLTPALRAHVDGIVNAPSATGQLTLGDEVYVFDNEPMILQGNGVVTAALAEDGAFEGDMALDAAGDFRAIGTTPSHILSEGSSSVMALFSGAAALVLVTTAGLVRVGVVPLPTKGSKSRRFDQCLRRARYAMEAGEYPRAADCYKKATRLRPDQPLAWFAWAGMELEAGRPEIADDIARRAQEVPGSDRLDLLELRANAAWELEDMESFERHVAEIAEQSPEIALGLCRDLGVESFTLEMRLRGRTTGEQYGGIDGYA